MRWEQLAFPDLRENAPEATIEDLARCDGLPVAIDVETSGLLWWSDSVIGVGIFCPEANVTGYITIRNEEQLEEIRKVILRWSASTLMIAHNIKFEMHFLGIPSWEVKFQLADTMIMSHLLNSRQEKSLNVLETKYLGTYTKKRYVEKAQGTSKKKKRVDEWDPSLIAAYCLNDCEVTYKLYYVLLAELEKWKLLDVFRMEMKFIRVVQESERKGFLLDIDFLAQSSKTLRELNQSLAESIFDAVGFEFNLNSSQQLSQAIYDNLGINKPVNPFPNPNSASEKLYNSTCTSTTLLVRHNHPLAALLEAYRETGKLLSAIENWKKACDENGFVHTNFNIAGTVTGRLSSSRPNIQNIPSSLRGMIQNLKTDLGVEGREEYFNMRKAFLPPGGFFLVAADYSQMEIRMFGFLSKDPVMLEALQSGMDVHSYLAEKTWGTSDPVHRGWAKVVSFGLIYGMSRSSLGLKLNLPAEQANRVAEDYFKTFPVIQPWLAKMTDLAKERGYVRMWSGRIWYRKPDPRYSYQAANALIQGGCADVLRVAALRIYRRIKKEIGPEAYIISFVHDEIVLAVPDQPDLISRAKKILEEEMPAADLFGLPWKFTSKEGRNYGETK